MKLIVGMFLGLAMMGFAVSLSPKIHDKVLDSCYRVENAYYELKKN